MQTAPRGLRHSISEIAVRRQLVNVDDDRGGQGGRRVHRIGLGAGRPTAQCASTASFAATSATARAAMAKSAIHICRPKKSPANRSAGLVRVFSVRPLIRGCPEG
ncbi:hypothetical protein Sala_0812 [Sphingopyxis alaskensis RB2256]|uniref:Uncharacterized protein n=1 Tax=Sphingopyxis alaskensis (strain DSM 13593 / LMG 18877 / RB2256) TaxID=317655 RepID=Q1GUZ1_SPHAL|nr:hypothetical protein Sala_0812 [Sphingopyxis alaskensis RB2256]